jgi:hypothetical protein
MSAWLRKTNAPGSAPGGYVWNTPEDVVEIEDEALAAELLEIPGAGFVSVPEPETDASPTGGGAESSDDGEAKAKDAPAPPRTRKSAAPKTVAKTEVQE